MSTKKQSRRLPKIGEKMEKREHGSDVKQIHERDVHILLSSHASKPAERLNLPRIGNEQLMKQPTGNVKPIGSEEKVATHFPTLPVKAVAKEQVKKLSQRSLSLTHEEPPKLLADCSNTEGRLLKRERQKPARLVPIENLSHSSSSSSCSEPTTELNKFCKLPGIESAQAKHSWSKSGNLHKPPCVLPPVLTIQEKLDKNLKLPPGATRRRLKVPEFRK